MNVMSTSRRLTKGNAGQKEAAGVANRSAAGFRRGCLAANRSPHTEYTSIRREKQVEKRSAGSGTELNTGGRGSRSAHSGIAVVDSPGFRPGPGYARRGESVVPGRRMRGVQSAAMPSQRATIGGAKRGLASSTRTSRESSASLMEVVAAESNVVRFLTAAQIAQSTPDKVDWVIEGLCARGAVTEIVGKIKAAGKTTFTLAGCASVLEGEPFLGLPSCKGGVIYLTEQPQSSFRQALRRAGLLDRTDFTVVFWRDVLGMPWPDLVRHCVQQAGAQGAHTLVVDTLLPFARMRGDAENSSGAALEAMQPLLEAAHVHRLAVIMVRHERKSGGDVGENARGNSAFGGAVDILLSLKRPEGNSNPSIRVLESLSRFDETPAHLAVQYTEGEYVALGTDAAVAQMQARDTIMKVLPGREAAALTLDDLLAEVKESGVRRTTCQEVLRELVDGAEVSQTGEGKRGSPYRYWLPQAVDLTPGAGQSAVYPPAALHTADEAGPDEEIPTSGAPEIAISLPDGSSPCALEVQVDAALTSPKRARNAGKAGTRAKKVLPPIRWFGGKGVLSASIVPLLPPHDVYVEAFGGAASVLLSKPPAKLEVYNDLNSGLVNLMRVLQDPAKFKQLNERLQHALYSREEFEWCKANWRGCTDDVEKAYMWYIIGRMCYGGMFDGTWGFGVDPKNSSVATTFRNAVRRLPDLQERLRGVMIEHDHWRQLVKRYDRPGTLWYLDPPYVPETRRSGGYEHDMTHEDHVELVDALIRLKGDAVVSGYRNRLYTRLERQGWKRFDRKWVSTTGGCNRFAKKRGAGALKESQSRIESLWVSPRIAAYVAERAVTKGWWKAPGPVRRIPLGRLK